MIDNFVVSSVILLIYFIIIFLIKCLVPKQLTTAGHKVFNLECTVHSIYFLLYYIISTDK